MEKEGAEGMVLYGVGAEQEEGKRRCEGDGDIWCRRGAARW